MTIFHVNNSDFYRNAFRELLSYYGLNSFDVSFIEVFGENAYDVSIKTSYKADRYETSIDKHSNMFRDNILKPIENSKYIKHLLSEKDAEIEKLKLEISNLTDALSNGYEFMEQLYGSKNNGN